jgi:hypothetical protein
MSGLSAKLKKKMNPSKPSCGFKEASQPQRTKYLIDLNLNDMKTA